MTLAKVKEQDGMMLAKVKEQDGMMLAKVKEQDGMMQQTTEGEHNLLLNPDSPQEAAKRRALS